MAVLEYLSLSDKDLLAQCRVHAYRASGPGGQKRNKTSSAIRLQHRPSGLSAMAEEDRSQHVNKARALKRLRRLLAIEQLQQVPLSDLPPSALLQGHVGEGGLRLGPRSGDFLPVVNEVLSILQSACGQIRTAAGHIGTSSANLLKFLEQDVHVWRKANHIRQQHALRPLKSAN